MPLKKLRQTDTQELNEQRFVESLSTLFDISVGSNNTTACDSSEKKCRSMKITIWIITDIFVTEINFTKFLVSYSRCISDSLTRNSTLKGTEMYKKNISKVFAGFLLQ